MPLPKSKDKKKLPQGGTMQRKKKKGKKASYK
jgi:hypothetical protein